MEGETGGCYSAQRRENKPLKVTRLIHPDNAEASSCPPAAGAAARLEEEEEEQLSFRVDSPNHHNDQNPCPTDRDRVCPVRGRGRTTGDKHVRCVSPHFVIT